MNWEETILFIRGKSEYSDLIKQTYMDEDLEKNVSRFIKSKEFALTKKLLKKYAPNGKTILDIGCGNGTSSISWSLEGYNVTAVEPDPSLTVGAGAAKRLKQKFNINNLMIYESFAEEIGLETESFDIVYVRQAMHHAYNLEKFLAECARVLKRRGVLITIRDHVIIDEKDKNQFLENHPLHKFYGGENAFTLLQYIEAIERSGLTIEKKLSFFDSEINFFPLRSNEIVSAKLKKYLMNTLIKILPFSITKGIWEKNSQLLNEKDFPGRMYSFIARKK